MINLKHSLKIFSLVSLIVLPVSAMQPQPAPIRLEFTSTPVASPTSFADATSSTDASSSGVTYQLVQNINPIFESSDKGFIDSIRKAIVKGYEKGIADFIAQLAVALTIDIASKSAVYGYKRFVSKDQAQEQDLAVKVPVNQELMDTMNNLKFEDKLIGMLEKQLEEQEKQEKLQPFNAQDAAVALQVKMVARKRIAALRMALLQKTNEASSRMCAEFAPTAEVAA